MAAEKGTILFVNNLQDDINLFSSKFSDQYTIYNVSTAQQAIDFLPQNTIDVIIAIQELPDMSGVKFFETIIPEYPDPIRVLLSADNDANTLIKAINEGQVFRYITKPWDEKELRQSIDVAVKICRLARSNRENIKLMHEETVKRERILNLFRKYVPAQAELEKSKTVTDTLFSGELRNVTVLFSSISGISKFTEETDLQAILKYLNKYFSLMFNCVEDYRGTIDKVIGGNLMAIFGAPIASINNQKDAVYCALKMLEKLKTFNAEYGGMLGNETKITIAINSGESIIGNIGSEQYISYTVIGSTVNTVSRMAEFALPNTILISEAVYEVVKDDFITECLGKKEIRGKEVPVNIYKIIKKKRG